ncbi:MAG: tRNA (guanosine(46)-N7)-methyltransferase TrmB [Campylobacteraceae bacterium]|nr:tRNA (guanosine(46)-N7)-methyltransferase TrmB [Campylobacteraceae bacterium]
MPNFRVKKLKEPKFPFEKDGVKFIDIAKGRVVDLLLVEAGGERFFITIKPSKELFVIKGEKLTRPAKVGLLQKALEIYRDEFCDELVSNSINFKKNSLTKNSEIIKDEISALNELKNHDKVAIEIGFGSGRHLLFQAGEKKDVFHLGIEIYKPGVEQVAKQALKSEISNLCLVNTDARNFLNLVQSNSVDTIYLHFPVPWDDAPHRRVISTEFMSEVQRVLKNGGTFELRSDSRAYVDFSMLKFLDMDFVNLEVFKNRDIEVSSKYEDRWKKQEKDIYDIIVKNYKISEPLNDRDSKFSFSKLNPERVYKNFRRERLKFDDFFLNFEEVYKFSSKNVLLKLSFGDFDVAQNCFILISDNETKYFINEPLKTIKNQKAHKKIGELLLQW